MKFYGRRRRYAKKGAGKRKYYRKGARVSKALKRYIKKAIHNQIENKVHVGYAANQVVVNSSVPTALYALPNPTQGVGSNNRIGQCINLMKSKIDMIFNLLPYNVTTNPTPTVQLVKLWLCSCKSVNTNSIGSTSILTNFFEGTGGVSVGSQNTTLDMLLTVNQDAWTVYETRYFKLGASNNSTPISNSGYFDNSPMSKKVSFNINKYVKRLRYDSTSVPNNRNLFIVMMTCNADGTTSGSQAVEYHYNARWEFEDA